MYSSEKTVVDRLFPKLTEEKGKGSLLLNLRFCFNINISRLQIINIFSYFFFFLSFSFIFSIFTFFFNFFYVIFLNSKKIFIILRYIITHQSKNMTEKNIDKLNSFTEQGIKTGTASFFLPLLKYFINLFYTIKISYKLLSYVFSKENIKNKNSFSSASDILVLLDSSNKIYLGRIGYLSPLWVLTYFFVESIYGFFNMFSIFNLDMAMVGILISRFYERFCNFVLPGFISECSNSSIPEFIFSNGSMSIENPDNPLLFVPFFQIQNIRYIFNSIFYWSDIDADGNKITCVEGDTYNKDIINKGELISLDEEFSGIYKSCFSLKYMIFFLFFSMLFIYFLNSINKTKLLNKIINNVFYLGNRDDKKRHNSLIMNRKQLTIFRRSLELSSDIVFEEVSFSLIKTWIFNISWLKFLFNIITFFASNLKVGFDLPFTFHKFNFINRYFLFLIKKGNLGQINTMLLLNMQKEVITTFDFSLTSMQVKNITYSLPSIIIYFIFFTKIDMIRKYVKYLSNCASYNYCLSKKKDYLCLVL